MRKGLETNAWRGRDRDEAEGWRWGGAGAAAGQRPCGSRPVLASSTVSGLPVQQEGHIGRGWRCGAGPVWCSGVKENCWGARPGHRSPTPDLHIPSPVPPGFFLRREYQSPPEPPHTSSRRLQEACGAGGGCSPLPARRSGSKAALRPPPPPPRPGPLLRMSHPRPSARRWGDAVVWAARPPAATTGFPSSRGHAWGQRGPGRDKGSWRAAALPPRRQGHPGERSGSSLRLLRSGALLATTAALETERPPWAPRTETS